MAYVSSKSELQEAIRKKEKNITVTGSLAKKLKPLAKTNKLNKSNNPTTQAALVGSLSLAGIGTAVAITLIVTVGLVVIIAILKDYNVTLKNGDQEVVLERN
ncbi:hypothetical protein [Lysinibacillus sp. G01H]|uniref:hypothetical protein n=1 Tax=Lysinibacillus sp. G01H TaxID=3026425 RepID=UPI00237E27DF|nr:hypothetical protein [Lysinibacillus sp. G01H]WDU78839.1 hypothetical protein PSR12_19675 [Lysinibacillus sp. G01H]